MEAEKEQAKKGAEPLQKMNLNCRFYRKEFPDKDELVMVQVREVQEVGAYVTLLEYNNIQGMIMLSEVSKRRIRSVRRIIRVGTTEVAVVLRVDQNKGYIDLSKKKVSAQEVEECEQRYAKSRKVHSLLANIAQLSSNDLEVVYQQIGWPLYDKYGHALEGLKLAMNEPEVALQGLNVDPKIQEVLMQVINQKMRPQKLRLRADFEVTCYQPEGIEAIKNSLRIGETLGTEEMEISIKLISSPQYYIETASFDKNGGIQILNQACHSISQAIEKSRGNFVVKVKPRVIGDSTDLETDKISDKSSDEESPEEDDEEGMDVDIEGVNPNYKNTVEEEEEEEEKIEI